MKILLLGFKKQDSNYETKRLISELKQRGHEVTLVLWSGIMFSFAKKEGPVIRKINGRDFKYFDYIIPRSPLSVGGKKHRKQQGAVYLSHLYRHYLLIIDYINRYHKHTLNERTAKAIPFYDKLFQHYLLSKHNLPVLTSLLYTGRQLPDSVYKKFKTPYIVKSIEGSRGQQVFLVKNTKEIPKLVEQFGLGKLLVQRYVPIKEDLRIIVVGKKVIGGMRRIAPEGDFRTNVAVGGFTEKIKVTPELEELALKAAKVFNAEFAGVDIVEYKGNNYILEVNIFPMFGGFEEATRINVVEKLASYIERKYLWSIEARLDDKEIKKHFEALFDIEKQTFEEALSPKAFQEEMAKKEVMAVLKEQKPIAYLTHTSERNIRLISRLVVANKYIGQRIGRRMLRELIRIAAEHGDKAVQATVPKAYIRRQQSFRRAGFTQTKVLKKHFGAKGDGLVFEYKVTPVKRKAARKKAAAPAPKSKKV